MLQCLPVSSNIHLKYTVLHFTIPTYIIHTVLQCLAVSSNTHLKYTKFHFTIPTYVIHVVLVCLPVGFNHLKHHVVLKVLNKIQHSLSQGKCSRIPPRSLEGVHFGRLVTNPHAKKYTNRQYRLNIICWQINL